MTVVAVAMLASLTVLPALLAALGDRIDRGRIPFLGRFLERRRGSGRSFWGTVAAAVMRRPVVSLLAAGGLLVALAVPALRLNTVVSGPSDMPREIPIVQTYDRLVASFPQEGAESVVVVQADDVRAPQVRGGDRRARRPRGAGPRRHRAGQGRDRRWRHGRGDRRADRRRRRQRRLDRGDEADPRADRPRGLRRRAGRQRRRHRQRRPVAGLPHPARPAAAAGLRLRPRPGVPVAAGDLPLDRRPDQGDRPQPALRRRRLRGPGARLPGRLGRKRCSGSTPTAASRPGCRCSSS